MEELMGNAAHDLADQDRMLENTVAVNSSSRRETSVRLVRIDWTTSVGSGKDVTQRGYVSI